MKLSIVPQKMDDGMIVAISVKQDDKEDVFTIPPAPFDNFEGMRKVIEKYYDLEVIWQESKQEYDDIKERFDLIDFRRNAALQDFRLLISPIKEEKLKSSTPVSVTGHEKVPEPTPALRPDSGKHGIILPPSTPIEAAQEASTDMRERAEQAGLELQNATITIGSPEEVVPSNDESDAVMIKMLKENPTLLTSDVKDALPQKALSVLETIAGRVETAHDTLDTSKPLKSRQIGVPISIQDWVKLVDAKVTARLEGTEFSEQKLEQELMSQGVPDNLVERVKTTLIKSWDDEGRFEAKDDNGIISMLKRIPKKIGFRGKKNEPK